MRKALRKLGRYFSKIMVNYNFLKDAKAFLEQKLRTGSKT